MRQLLDSAWYDIKNYADQSQKLLSASAKHLPRCASSGQTKPHSIIAKYLSHYAGLTAVFSFPGRRYEQLSLHAEEKAKGTRFDIFTSLLNTTFE